MKDWFINSRDSRKAMLAAAEEYADDDFMYKDIKEAVEVFDELSPGWKTCLENQITFDDNMADIVTELPGRIFIRGWDQTGAIHSELLRA